MIEGTIYTARELSAEDVARITEHFSGMVHSDVSFKVKVDTDLVIGIRVEVGGSVWDGSAKMELADVLKSFQRQRERLKTGESLDPLHVNSLPVSPLDERTDRSQMMDDFNQRLSDYRSQPGIRPLGKVLRSGDGIVAADGLKGCRYGEMLEFENGTAGIAFNLKRDEVGIILLDHANDLSQGMTVTGTGHVAEVPVGDSVIGRVLDPLGRPLDRGAYPMAKNFRPIEADAPQIIDRKPVSVPLQTGILAIDSMVPIGRGQRELIIGDRQTGKTTIAIDAILNQKNTGVLCIYVAIGQKSSSVAGVYQTLRRAGAMDYTTIISATAADPAPLQYIAPYAGCAMAEEFMHNGRDVLIVYDDLSKHAVAYRAISLLLKRPPGREAYPGDVFYLHSRLLERASSLDDKLGGGTMTALPIIETISGDISAYIPTNVISITDGQIFLESELFRSGVRPAVNVGQSVSRVGGSAQTRAMRKVCGQLRLDLAQFRELAAFSQFGTDLDAATMDQLRQGERLMEALKQNQHQALSMPQQVMLLFVVTRGFTHNIAIENMKSFVKDFLQYVALHYPQIETHIEQTRDLDDTVEQMIQNAFSDYEAGLDE
jgi:F-type H+-transporting ATPase subunit alpha